MVCIHFCLSPNLFPSKMNQQIEFFQPFSVHPKQKIFRRVRIHLVILISYFEIMFSNVTKRSNTWKYRNSCVGKSTEVENSVNIRWNFHPYFSLVVTPVSCGRWISRILPIEKQNFWQHYFQPKKHILTSRKGKSLYWK